MRWTIPQWDRLRAGWSYDATAAGVLGSGVGAVCRLLPVVRVGRWVSVAGTTGAAEDGGAVGGSDIVAQAREAVRRIAVALERAGAGLQDVVRPRMLVTDLSRWREVGQAHGKVFGAIRPATSLLEVSALIDPALLVEIEADAIVP